MKILISAVGDTDPIRNFHDGPLLHIVRVYRPEKIVLVHSERSLTKHDKLVKALKSIKDYSPEIIQDGGVLPDAKVAIFDEMYDTVSSIVKKYISDESERHLLLKTIHYEASRAGLEPRLVLGLIMVESGFKKYAFSSVGARGYMQIMPFWIKLIGNDKQNLFHLRTNLRYGCTILRHYLDIEKGNLFRALGRYNGSLGKAQYPNAVFSSMKYFYN